MAERRRFLLPILTMPVVTLAAVGSGARLLHDIAFDEERPRLIDTAQSQPRPIEAVARFDSVYNRDCERIERQKRDRTIGKPE